MCENGFCVTPTVDAGADVDGPTADADTFDCKIFEGRQFKGCDIPRPTESLTLDVAGTYTYNTDTGALGAPGGTTTTPANVVVPAGRVISVEAFNLASGARLRVLGAKPLIVASWSTIDVAGVIDASSNATENGAGANPSGCAQHAAGPGQSNTSGAGGGGGGGNGGAGAAGGRGDAGNGGAGGATVTAPLLLGGCAGGNGGNGNQLGGAGGSGGGAIQLTARDSVTIRGTVHAGGAGGAGGSGGNDAAAGGGGGGTGGMIGIESMSITIQSGAILAANGGGGGGGSDDQLGGRGQDGQPLATRAVGGTEVNAGRGGLGSGGAVLTGGIGGDSGANGAGGGGGGAGFIVLAATTAPSVTGAIVSPAASTISR